MTLSERAALGVLIVVLLLVILTAAL